ncbi:MAG: PEP-CTERM sorting domain-containing protein [Terriglobales bacterium]
MPKIHCQLAKFFPVAVLCAGLLGTSVSARADTLAGDSLTVSLLCYANSACSGTTQTNPYLAQLASFVVPTGNHGFTFSQSSPLSEHLVGSFTNNATITNTTWTIIFSVEQSNGTLADLESGGFVGLQVSATDALSNPLAVTIASNTGSTDGFALGDIAGNGSALLDLNFAGLTGTSGFNKAVLSLGDVTEIAAVPEPASLVLLASGLLALLGVGYRRKLNLFD